MGAHVNPLEGLALFLRELKVEGALPERDVVVLHDLMTLEAALRVLAEREILSAPVLTGRPGEPSLPVPRSQHAEGDALGFIAIRDILFAFIASLPPSGPVREPSVPLPERAVALEAAGTDFCTHLVSDVRPFMSDGSFIHSRGRKSKLTLWEVTYSSLLHPAARPPSEAGAEATMHHRAVLFNSQHEMCQIVSQTDVIRILHSHKHAPRVAACLETRMMDMPDLCSRRVLTITSGESALAALALMQRHAVSAVAVVADATGALRGAFSLSALRSIACESFSSLALPVGEFLALRPGSPGGAGPMGGPVREGSAEVDSGSESGGLSGAALAFVRQASRRAREAEAAVAAAPRALSLTATVAEFLDLIVSRRDHRAYFVDDDMRPVAVATLTDLLHAIAGERPPTRPSW